VFVASDKSGKIVTRRKSRRGRRGEEQVFIRSQPNATEKSAGCEPLVSGEWVVASGTIELSGALDDEVASLPPSHDDAKQ